MITLALTLLPLFLNASPLLEQPAPDLNTGLLNGLEAPDGLGSLDRALVVDLSTTLDSLRPTMLNRLPGALALVLPSLTNGLWV